MVWEAETEEFLECFRTSTMARAALNNYKLKEAEGEDPEEMEVVLWSPHAYHSNTCLLLHTGSPLIPTHMCVCTYTDPIIILFF